MTTIRPSLPSRLRQLLSGEGSLVPSVKLDSETPPKIKSFIDKVIQCPLQDIAIPLSGFRWEYNKGNFHHWRPLFLHFDTYFKTYLSSRNDLLLSDKLLEDDSLLPKQAVLQILRVMQTILENCHNKGSFDGLENFKLLLASTDPEILIATLETLSALVKINPSKLHGGGKLIGCGSVNSYLLSLAQGWGSKEEGLGLYSCVMANERTQEEGLCLFPSDVENDRDKSHCRIGSTLYFEMHGVNAQSTEENGNQNTSNLRVIHIPDLHLQKVDDLLLLQQCIEQYNVPPELRFSLLTRIRYAHAFRSPRICRLYSRICLLAFIVLVQSSDAHDELVSFFANEPEYTNELIRIVRSEEVVKENQHFESIIEEVASSLGGALKVGSINCDTELSFCKDLGIYPRRAARVFVYSYIASDGGSLVEYSGDLAVKSLKSFCQEHLPRFSKRVDLSHFEFSSATVEKLPRVMLLSKKKDTPVIWRVLSGLYRKRFVLYDSEVRDVTDPAVKRFGVDALPAIVGWLSNGEQHILKTGISVKDLKSAVHDLSNLLDSFEKKNKKAGAKKAQTATVEKHIPLLTGSSFDALCGESTPVCIIGVYRSSRAREKLESILSMVSQKSLSRRRISAFGSRDSISYTLLDATKQAAFLNAFDKGGFKSADKLLVAYKPRKRKFAAYVGEMTTEEVEGFISSVLNGDIQFKETRQKPILK